VIKRLSRLYPEAVLHALRNEVKLREADLLEEAFMQQWALHFEKILSTAKGPITYTVGVQHNPETQAYCPKIITTQHGNVREYVLTREFLNSADYLKLAQLADVLQGLIVEGAYIQRADKKQMLKTFDDALVWLMSEAKRGLSIQRYKGLGEMNADQLWETTMDPTVRMLLQVRIQDAILADQICSTLMGDQVEPRRDFIESNALFVTNLDI
jgi:DNA gyrase subunit B